MVRTTILSIAVIITASTTLFSDTINIPADYPTIQEGIDAAINGDTVLVAPGTYVENIDFLGKAITVKGEQGAAATIIDGNQNGSVVTFDHQEKTDSIIEGFQIVNGTGTSNGDDLCGGGIYCGNTTTPIIRHNTIKDNQADLGGGIYSDNASPKINHNIVSGNAAYYGGGIYCLSGKDVKIIRCCILDNFADERGGAVFLKACSPKMINNLITLNESPYRGGGIYCIDIASPTIVNNTVAMNISKNSAGIYAYNDSNPKIWNSIFWNPKGSETENEASEIKIKYSNFRGGWDGVGNIYAKPMFVDGYYGNLHLTQFSPCRDAGSNAAPDLPGTDIEGDSRIVNGTVDMGADEYTVPQGSPGTYHVPKDYATIQEAIDSAFIHDTVIVAPGTYYENILFKGRSVTLKSRDGPYVTVIDGVEGAGTAKGSVVTFYDGEDNDTVLEGFTIKNGTGYELYSNRYYGGGIFCAKGTPIFKKNIITANQASDGGGGIYFCAGGSGKSVVFYCDIYENFVDSHEKGGGIYSDGTEVLIEHCKVRDHQDGGGIHIEDSNATIRNCTVTSNICRQNYAGGICCRNHYSWTRKVVIENNIVFNNFATLGGGLYVSIMQGFVRNNMILYNSATLSSLGGGYGGGIYATGEGVSIENNLIAFNKARVVGGGVRARKSTLKNNVICYNEVRGSNWTAGGGGVSVSMDFSTDSTEIANCLIFKNDGVNAGGGISFHTGKLILKNCTLYGNTALAGKGIFGSESATLDITNSVLRNDPRDEIYLEQNDPVVTHSNIWGGWPGTGNIDADPLFVDPDMDDFHLTYQSPCRDAGDNDAVTEEDDFEGDPRIAWNGTVDMGCDEFYTHLYYTGDASPGGEIEGKFVGLPGTSPVGLFIGSEILQSPVPTAWGEFHLQPPWMMLTLIPIPSNGVLVIPARIPVIPYQSYDLYLQALIGLNPDSLTNLCTLEVRNY